MKTKVYFVLMTVLLMTFVLSCKPDPEPNNDVLSNNYSGSLELYFKNDVVPHFESSKKVDAYVSKSGEVTFGTGTLQYSGEEVDNTGQTKIKREGSIQMAPKGNLYKNNDGKYHISIDENCTVNEHIVQWIKDNQGQWLEVVNTNMSDTWHGGLDFLLVDAIDPAVIEVNTGNGTVRWTLSLLPTLD